MKKLLIVMLALFVFLGITIATYAKTPSDKLSRGIANIPGGLLEIPKNIDLEWKASKNAAVGIFCGIAKGTVMGIARIGSGLWDIVTFPAAVPKGYEPILKPDLVFDKEK